MSSDAPTPGEIAAEMPAALKGLVGSLSRALVNREIPRAKLAAMRPDLEALVEQLYRVERPWRPDMARVVELLAAWPKPPQPGP